MGAPPPQYIIKVDAAGGPPGSGGGAQIGVPLHHPRIASFPGVLPTPASWNAKAKPRQGRKIVAQCVSAGNLEPNGRAPERGVRYRPPDGCRNGNPFRPVPGLILLPRYSQCSRTGLLSCALTGYFHVAHPAGFGVN